MLDSLPIALAVGTLFGFLAGLGIGGGSLLILWLTAVLGMEPSTSRGINLLFFLPAACIACLFRFRQGTLHWKRVVPAIAGGCAPAAPGSVTQSEICGGPQNRGAVTGKKSDRSAASLSF